jgi:cytochrome b subunit of formate dehydrogenase
MATSSETVSETAAIPAREKAQGEGYFTYVEGVGSIPRDIYKYVKSDPLGDLPRYSVHIVIQHLLIFITFMFLVTTGLPIYFSDVFWAPVAISFFGGIDSARLIHRIAGFTMMFAAAYHVVTIAAGTLRQLLNGQFDYKRTQIPRLKDLYDLIHDLKYFLGIEAHRPKMEKFMYKQKLHYLAIICGSLVLIAAGSALLFPDIMAKIIPGTLGKILPEGAIGAESYSAFFQSLARLMHADEAVMALIVVAFWHWSNVHLVPGRFPMQWTFLTGKITREHQIEEHFLEYLNNLREIPEEREYMRNLLAELGLDASPAKPSPDRQTSAAQPEESGSEDSP